MNFKQYNNKSTSKLTSCLIPFITLLFFALVSCKKQEYIPKPIDLETNYQYIIDNDLTDEAFQKFIEYIIPKSQNLTKDLDFLTVSMLYFNPEIQTLIKDIPIKEAQKIVALTRANPTVQIPLEYHSEIFDGFSPWTIGLVKNFFYERQGKRDAKTLIAEANIEQSKLQVENKAWELYLNLYRAYWEFYLNQYQLNNIKREIELKTEVVDLLLRRQEFGEANNFEISTARLSLQRELLEQSQYVRNMHEAYHNILTLIGIDKKALELTELYFDLEPEFYTSFNLSENDLKEAAIHQRTDFLLALQTYLRNEAELKFQIEKQYPDINLSPGFVYDQGDQILSLGLSWILPLLHNNEPSIEKAIKVREKQQQQILALQTKMLNQIQYRLNDFNLRIIARKIALDLLAQFHQRHEIIQTQYELGAIDRLDFLRAELERINLEQSLIKLTVEEVIAVGELQAVVQYPVFKQVNIKEIAAKLIESRLNVEQ